MLNKSRIINYIQEPTRAPEYLLQLIKLSSLQDVSGPYGAVLREYQAVTVNFQRTEGGS